MTEDTNSEPVYRTLAKDHNDASDYMLGGSNALDGEGSQYEVSFKNLSLGERIYLVNTFESNRRRHRRLHQVTVAAQERREAKISRLRVLFLQDKIWAAEGGRIAIKDMTPNHALNSYNLITREWQRYAGVGIAFHQLQTGHANVHSTPLGRALYAQSQKRETRRHKRMDAESRERYKDRLAKAQAVAGAIWKEF